jgi:hypothetical protein
MRKVDTLGNIVGGRPSLSRYDVIHIPGLSGYFTEHEHQARMTQAELAPSPARGYTPPGARREMKKESELVYRVSPRRLVGLPTYGPRAHVRSNFRCP